MRESGRRLGPWLVVGGVVLGLAVVVLLAWLSLLRTAERVPASIVQEGREVARGIGELARAFRQGTVTELFVSRATALTGTSYLQVATLEQVETFELRDSSAVFWGTVPLPDVVVRATAPVTTTYYVDIDDEWRFELRGSEVAVLAPPLRYNKPAIDVSRLELEIREGSPLRDEDVALDKLKRELTGRSAILAERNEPLVRDTARSQVEGFVETWLLEAFADAEGYRVRVLFADEPEAAEFPEPESPEVVEPDRG